jgi:hypothetical protein
VLSTKSNTGTRALVKTTERKAFAEPKQKNRKRGGEKIRGKRGGRKAR